MREETISSLGVSMSTNELKGILEFKINHPSKLKGYNRFRQELTIDTKFGRLKKIGWGTGHLHMLLYSLKISLQNAYLLTTY